MFLNNITAGQITFFVLALPTTKSLLQQNKKNIIREALVVNAKNNQVHRQMWQRLRSIE